MKLTKTYKYIIFDFDGTLNDTSPGIYATFTAVLNSFGADASRTDLSRHIGPPLEDSYTELLGADRCAAAVALHKQIFSQTHAAENSRLYDGITDVLAALQAHGYVLSIASSKYEPHAIESLRYHKLTDYFQFVYGQTDKRGFKRDVLAQLIGDHGWNKDECLLIGDTVHDALGAEYCNIDFVAVTYGFGKEDELKKFHPISTVSSPKQILELLI